MPVGNSNTDQTHLICELTVGSNRSPAVLFSTPPSVDWQLGVNGCFSGAAEHTASTEAVISPSWLYRRAAQRLITWWNQHKLVMITLSGVPWLSNSTDRILTPIFTSLFYLPCLFSRDRYGPPPSSLATNQPWHLVVTKNSWRVTFKPLKFESNLWLGRLFASWIFMSALLFFDGISELIQRADFILLSDVPAATIGNWLLIQGPRCSQQRFYSCFVWGQFPLMMQILSNRSKTNIYIWMKRRHEAFKCLLIAQKHCLHLLTASKRECEEMIKNSLLLHNRAFWDFHLSVITMAALWLMLFVSFMLIHSREHQHCTTLVLRGLILSKTHTCVFWGVTKVHLAAGALFKGIASFLG